MYENHRDNFGRRRYEEERGHDREPNWRREEERYRRESAEQDRYDQSRYGNRNRDFGYGQSSRDQDQSGWFGAEPGVYGSRGGGGERWLGQGYRGEQTPRRSMSDYDNNPDRDRPGDSSYFTGQQGSWAVRSPYGASSYGGAGGFGDDYREHGYGARSHDHGRGFFDRAGDEMASWFGDEDAARRREQDHRGRGPKNYVRSDERIQDDANDRLTEDWRIDAENVTVTVKDGEVTLDGTVTDRAAKRRAEDIVEDISGVKHVQNNLRVADRSGITSQTGMSSPASSSFGTPTGSGSSATGSSGTASGPTSYGGTGATGQNATAKESEKI